MYALLPTAVGLIWAAGILALAGVELDLFAVFAVVTFVGIGVDYGIHLVHRFQARGDAEHATAELAPVILVGGRHHAGRLRHAGLVVVSSAPVDRHRVGREHRGARRRVGAAPAGAAPERARWQRLTGRG